MLRLALVVTGIGAVAAIGAASCGGDDFVNNPPTTSNGGNGGAGAEGGTSDGGATDGGGGMGGAPPMCFDVDMDGVTDCEGDCDDADPTSYPGASEICGDGADNDCMDGADQATICQGIGTWVSNLTGDDTSGDGTQLNPVQTIGKGIANALLLGPGHDVYVAEGNYAEAIDMVDGMDLWGGHQCDTTSCSWARDPSLYLSQIGSSARRGVFAGITVRHPTTIDGFTLIGRDNNGPSGNNQDPGSAAITVIGGSPIISGNIIQGGNETNCITYGQCGSYGVRITGPTNDPVNGVIVANNELRGGSAVDMEVAAIAIHRTPAVAKIHDNYIVGGVSKWTRAILAESSSNGTEIRNNEVFAGAAHSGGTSFAIFVSGYTVVDKNLINHDPLVTGNCENPGSFWCGGIEAAGAITTITNNVILGMASPKSIGIHVGDNEATVGFAVINANTIDASGATAGGAIVTATSTALACRTFVGNNGQIGDIRNNILLGGKGTNRFGFIEQDDNNVSKQCRPVVYDNNDVFFPAQGGATDNAHRQWLGATGANLLPTVAEVNVQSWADNNIGTDPLLDNTWHLNTGSSCIDAGTTSQAPATDIDADPRPQGNGVDIGADEAG